MGTSLDRLRDAARIQGWIQSSKLEETKEALNNLIRLIGNRMILPEKMDVKEVLKRGKLVAEQDIWEGR
jgi:hypothetical protein